MGLLTNRVERNEIKPGDHIYTYRAIFAYSHHGIYVGGSKVVHFTPRQYTNSSSDASESYGTKSRCSTFPDCGFRKPSSGVVLSCLDCFLQNGSLYSFEYGVTPSIYLSRIRGGTCTTAGSDISETVVHRAMYLLQNGFGNYDLFQNNCEDFTLYCKTGLLIVDNSGVGRSGQASFAFGAPLAALLSSPFKMLMPSPIGVATVTAGIYCISRYATDIGVRSDVIKVAVEDLSVNLGWESCLEEETGANDAVSDAIKVAVEDLSVNLGWESCLEEETEANDAVSDVIKVAVEDLSVNLGWESCLEEETEANDAVDKKLTRLKFFLLLFKKQIKTLRVKLDVPDSLVKSIFALRVQETRCSF